MNKHLHDIRAPDKRSLFLREQHRMNQSKMQFTSPMAWNTRSSIWLSRVTVTHKARRVDLTEVMSFTIFIEIILEAENSSETCFSAFDFFLDFGHLNAAITVKKMSRSPFTWLNNRRNYALDPSISLCTRPRMSIIIPQRFSTPLLWPWGIIWTQFN